MTDQESEYVPKDVAGPTPQERFAALKALRQQCDAKNAAAVLAPSTADDTHTVPAPMVVVAPPPPKRDRDAPPAGKKTASDDYRKQLRRIHGTYGATDMKQTDAESVAKRVSDDVVRTIARRDKFSTRRTTFDEIANDGVNDSNQRFNEKLRRQYDPHTQALRRNMEGNT